jgi:hypothetical protein
MRQADRPTAEEQLFVAAGPEHIWPFVIDIGLPARVSDELQAAEWERPGGDVAVGRRFVGTNCNEFFGEWQTTSTVIECDRPRAFSWAVGEVTEPITTWRFILRPDGAGTVVRQWVQLGVGPSYLQDVISAHPDHEERIVGERMQQFRVNMRANLLEVKRLAEVQP